MPEWQIEKNQWGGERKYYIDECGRKNYEMMIDGVPESRYAEIKERERAESLERMKKLNQTEEKSILCPFRMLRDCASLRCAPECALHTADGCGMVSDATLSGGTICPMKPGYKCSTACMLHGVDGCKLTGLLKREE